MAHSSLSPVKNRRANLAPLGLVLLLTPAPASALEDVSLFRMAPMELVLTPESAGREGELTVENQGQQSLQARIEVTARTSAAGTHEEQRQPTTELEVSPPVLALAAGGSAKVKLLYKGPEQLQTERAYRVVIAAAPTSPVRLQYVASVYVTPAGAKPQLTVKSVQSEPVATGGGGRVKVELANTGGAHQTLAALVPLIEIRPLGPTAVAKPLTVREASLKQWQKGNVLAQSGFSIQLETQEAIDPAVVLSLRLLPKPH